MGEHEICSGWDCFVCGDVLTIYTDASQTCDHEDCEQPCDCRDHFSWWAHDGDPVVCLECGAEAMVSTDGEGADISYDETSEHNLACWERYENRG